MQKRKSVIISLAMLLCGSMAFSQSNDPVVMTVNGKPVLRSEFEYAYRKNNSAGVIDRKSVAEYAELFIDYKLKVEAALAAQLDTLTSFKEEFAGCRDQQIRPSLINDADIEAEARRIYTLTQHQVDSLGGMVKVRHILLELGQRAPKSTETEVKQRIDSIYKALKAGADFSEMARKYSDDKGSASAGGSLPWLQPGQTLPEFEAQAYRLKKGEMSLPFLSPAGYHIILLEDKSNFLPYDSLRNDILCFIDQRNLRDKLIDDRLNERAQAAHTTPAAILEKQRMELEKNDPSLKYLIQEYHDGLLLFEISNRTIWEKAARDEAGLIDYFNHNKKKYRWSSSRYKGVIFHVKEVGDVKKVTKALKKADFEKWGSILEKQFNQNGEIRVKAEKGIFKQGDNAWIDSEIFKHGAPPAPLKDYPFSGVCGKKLKAPKTMSDVRKQVLSDYQEAMERQWIKELRAKYPVSINQNVLQTIKELY